MDSTMTRRLVIDAFNTAVLKDVVMIMLVQNYSSYL
ncbi:Hypothetical protein CCH01_007350 [Clostridium chauvoei JF4335]|nr:Hypothetical protein CCH01_007350 [Clostridium chauvoei JF4335]